MVVAHLHAPPQLYIHQGLLTLGLCTTHTTLYLRLKELRNSKEWRGDVANIDHTDLLTILMSCLESTEILSEEFESSQLHVQSTINTGNLVQCKEICSAERQIHFSVSALQEGRISKLVELQCCVFLFLLYG